MDRIKLLSMEEAPESSKKQMEDITAKMGKVANLFKAMAHSPAALKTYFKINEALEEKTLDDANAERIAIRQAAINGCDYCLAAHSYLGSKFLSADEITSAREGKSTDEKAQAVLDIAASLMKTAGKISDEELATAREKGINDAEIMDIITLVSLNFFTNLVNNTSQTRVDFPKPKN